MTPWMQAVIVGCIVALTVALILTLLALRKTALRAEAVLSQIEREMHPLARQIESLTGELQKLSQHANRELERVGVAVSRLEDVTTKVARLVGALASLTQVGQLAGAAFGLKRGLAVFIKKLRD